MLDIRELITANSLAKTSDQNTTIPTDTNDTTQDANNSLRRRRSSSISASALLQSRQSFLATTARKRRRLETVEPKLNANLLDSHILSNLSKWVY